MFNNDCLSVHSAPEPRKKNALERVFYSAAHLFVPKSTGAKAKYRFLQNTSARVRTTAASLKYSQQTMLSPAGSPPAEMKSEYAADPIFTALDANNLPDLTLSISSEIGTIWALAPKTVCAAAKDAPKHGKACEAKKHQKVVERLRRAAGVETRIQASEGKGELKNRVSSRGSGTKKRGTSSASLLHSPSPSKDDASVINPIAGFVSASPSSMLTYPNQAETLPGQQCNKRNTELSHNSTSKSGRNCGSPFKISACGRSSASTPSTRRNSVSSFPNSRMNPPPTTVAGRLSHRLPKKRCSAVSGSSNASVNNIDTTRNGNAAKKVSRREWQVSLDGAKRKKGTV